MAEVVQCDVCKKVLTNGDEEVTRLSLYRHRALVGGTDGPPLEYDICAECLGGVRLCLSDDGYPEIVGVE